MTFYDNVYEVIIHGKQPEINMEQVVNDLLIIERARESHDKQAVINL